MDIQQFGSEVLSRLGAISDEVRALRTQRPAAQPEDRVNWYFLSNNETQLDIAIEAHVVALFISDSSTGRGTLNIDGLSIPFYTDAWVEAQYRFGPNDFIIRGGRVTWTPPGVSDTYDIKILARAR